MTADILDWTQIASHVLWMRLARDRKHWYARCTGPQDLLLEMLKKKRLKFPGRSWLILPKWETPLLEKVERDFEHGGES